MKRPGGHGFTIVELLIVIVVIGILAAIVMVAWSGVTKQAYNSRAESELASMADAVKIYYSREGDYPADVNRGIPAGITKYMNGEDDPNWPTAPWPESEYDYDRFTGSDGNPVVQISVRFCKLGTTLADCHFPNEPWAAGFQFDSSAYWCIIGKCRAHADHDDSYPAYCLNCSSSATQTGRLAQV